MTENLIPIRPVNGNIIIKPTLEGEFYGGGIIARPKSHQFDCLYGEVVAVGRGEFHEASRTFVPTAAIGDVVMYAGAWQGEQIEHDGERYRVLSPESVIAVVEDMKPGDEIQHLQPI